MSKRMKIVVVGGGTAGWLSALNANKHTDAEVVLVESEEIGILGAGEGTTPHFVTMLDELGIPVVDLIRDAGATIKTCIEFSNWAGDGTSYVHHFKSSQTLDPFIYKDGLPGLSTFHAGDRLDDVQFTKKCIEAGKVPFSFRDCPEVFNDTSIEVFNQYGLWGVHFDAVRVAQVLKHHAVSRNIVHRQGVVVKTDQDADGCVVALHLDSGAVIDEIDLLIDCTGFARVFLGKLFGADWVSHEHYLPMDSAVPFTLPLTGNVAPKTDAIAMGCGWVWRIPVQSRYGCGYVYDSDYCTREQAVQEIVQTFGENANIIDRTFRFRAGYYKQTLIKNCFAVGLSQGFVEPLEATNIWVQCMALWDFFGNNLWDKRKSAASVAAFNERMQRLNQSVGDFVHMHYLTPRKDTSFWQEFRSKNPTPKRISDALDVLRDSPKSFSGFDGSQVTWSWDSMLAVAYGTGEVQCAHPLPFNTVLRSAFESNQQRVAYMCFSHKDLLEFLGAREIKEMNK